MVSINYGLDKLKEPPPSQRNMATEPSTESNQIIISVTNEQPRFSAPNQHAKRNIKQHRATQQPIIYRIGHN